VAGWTPKSRATSAAVFRPDMTMSTISPRWAGVSFGRRPPLGPGGPQACARALPDHGALELGKGPQHLHHHPAGRTGGVHRLGQRAEPGLGLLDPLQDEQQVLQRPRQPVELPHHHDVAGSQLVEQPVQLRAIPAAARSRCA